MRSLLLSLLVLPWLAAAAVPEYKEVPNWCQKSADRPQLGNMHGDVAVSSAGEVYVSVMDPRAPVQVFGADGKFLRLLADAPPDFHGFVIRQDATGEFIYGARLTTGDILKMTLEGQTVISVPASIIPDQFKANDKQGQPTVKLTGMDVAPNGDWYVTDGYSSDYVHRFDKTGKYLESFGGKGEPYKFKTLHKLTIDSRFNPVRILACDRADNRLVHLSLDGKLLGVVASDLRFPAAVAIQGDLAVVGELRGGVVLLDKEGKMLTRFGVSEAEGETGSNKVEPEKWRNGVVTAPHGVAFDSHGNIFVAEWNIYGRLHFFERQ